MLPRASARILKLGISQEAANVAAVTVIWIDDDFDVVPKPFLEIRVRGRRSLAVQRRQSENILHASAQRGDQPDDAIEYRFSVCVHATKHSTQPLSSARD